MGRTDSVITICLPKFLWGHKKSTVECSGKIVWRGHFSHKVDKYLCISDFPGSFSSFISKRNHISSTMKKISYISDILQCIYCRMCYVCV